MGTTTNYAIPYPEPTDFVTDGAQAMENIAEQVDSVLQAGTVARNLLYNGAMQIAQRGTSATSLTSGDYRTVDRWYFQINSLGTWSMTQATSAASDDFPGATTGTYSGFRASAKMTMTSAAPTLLAGSQVQFRQAIEGQDLQAIRKGKSTAQQVTVSFWVKASKSGTYIFEMYDNDNTRQVSKSYVINATNTWEYKTILIPADTTGMFDNDNGLSAYFLWWLAAGSTYTSGTLNTNWASDTSANRAVGQVNLADTTNAYWQITGVQVTVGNSAPPFQFKAYQTEMRECQRYYYRTGGTVTSDIYISGYQPASTNIIYTYFHPVKMRATPTIQQRVGTWLLINSPDQPIAGGASVDAYYIYIKVNAGISNANQSAAYTSNSTTYVEMGAEL